MAKPTSTKMLQSIVTSWIGMKILSQKLDYYAQLSQQV